MFKNAEFFNECMDLLDFLSPRTFEDISFNIACTSKELFTSQPLSKFQKLFNLLESISI